jgi:hypothetical protein
LTFGGGVSMDLVLDNDTAATPSGATASNPPPSKTPAKR